jgi:hypothetical protein
LTAPEDAAVTGYNIYNNEVLLNDSAITDTNYAVAGLNSNTAYTYGQSNRNEGSLSEATDAVTVTTVASAPTGLQASETTSSTYLSWMMQMLLVTIFIGFLICQLTMLTIRQLLLQMT